MEKRILGKTGWEISVISFGAIKLSRLYQKKCDILLNRAIDAGINFVDTADCYGDSEEKIGKALGERRKEIYLSTKIDERDSTGVRKKLERFLHRLRTDWIDLVLFHDVRGSEYDRIFNSGGIDALERAKKEGKILEIGISIHNSVTMMKKAIDSGAFSALMVAYSTFDEDRLAADLLPMANKIGVGLIAMKTLAGGKLADGTRHELYQGFLIDGEEELSDLDFLLKEDFIDNGTMVPLSLIEDKLNMLTRNYEAKIRSDHEGVVNIRHKCIGIQAVN